MIDLTGSEPKILREGAVPARRGVRAPDGARSVSAGAFAVRRAVGADLPLMRRLWDEFSTEAHYTPYPSSPLTRRSSATTSRSSPRRTVRSSGTLYANLSTPHFGYVFGVYRCRALAAGVWGGR